MSSHIFSVTGLDSGYGQSQVIHNLNLDVGKREIVAVMGRNGMGKTTLFKTLMGIIPSFRGRYQRGWQPRSTALHPTSACSRAWLMCRRGG